MSLFLLPAPDRHNEAGRQELCEPDLCADRGTAYRDILAFFHIAMGTVDDLLRRDILIIVGYRIVGRGSVKEVRLYPAGADGKDSYLVLFKLLSERAGEAEYESLRRGVDPEVGDGLDGGQRA